MADVALGEKEVQIPQQESFVYWQPRVRTLGPCPHTPTPLNNLGSLLDGFVPDLQSHFRCGHLTAVQLQYLEPFQAWLLGQVPVAKYGTEEDSMLSTEHRVLWLLRYLTLEPAGLISGIEPVQEEEHLCLSLRI